LEIFCGVGGGIWNSGTLMVSNSTLSGNGGGNRGGGIWNSGTATVSNSTLSGNIANCDDFSGGGIENSGTLMVSNSTLFGNFAIFGSGGIYNVTGTLDLRNTILAGNLVGGFGAPDLLGPLTSSGYNLIGNTSGGSGYAPTDLLNVNPLLGPLANNGGPTLTHALLPGSP